MINDKIKASDETYCCTFEMQNAILYPKPSTSIAYYKHNLNVYNFVPSFNNNMGYTYVWQEIEGGRGYQELSIIVAKHLKETASKHKKIILYSHACGGQNVF